MVEGEYVCGHVGNTSRWSTNRQHTSTPRDQIVAWLSSQPPLPPVLLTRLCLVAFFLTILVYLDLL